MAKEENKKKGQAEEYSGVNAGQPPPEVAQAMAAAQSASQSASRGGTRGGGGDPDEAFETINEHFDEFKEFFEDTFPEGDVRDNLVEKYVEMDESIGDWMNEMEDESMLSCLINSLEQEDIVKIGDQFKIDFAGFYASYNGDSGPTHEQLLALKEWNARQKEIAVENARNRMQVHENGLHVGRVFDALIDG